MQICPRKLHKLSWASGKWKYAAIIKYFVWVVLSKDLPRDVEPRMGSCDNSRIELAIMIRIGGEMRVAWAVMCEKEGLKRAFV